MSFINCSNHPSTDWCNEQRSAAERFGEIIDLPFPRIPACADEQRVDQIAVETAAKILRYSPDAVMCQGEFTVTYRIVSLLKDKGVMVLSACSERDVQQTINKKGETVKEVKFHFVQFRNY